MNLKIKKIIPEEYDLYRNILNDDFEMLEHVWFYLPNSFVIYDGNISCAVCELYNLAENGEIRFALFSAFRGQHKGKEILNFILDFFCKQNAMMPSIYMLVAANNIRCLRLMQDRSFFFDNFFYERIFEEGGTVYYPYYKTNPYFIENQSILKISKELKYENR